MLKRILVVCTGNICRSPLAAAMLQQGLTDIAVMSAGLAAGKGGADKRIAVLAKADGYDLDQHQARSVDRRLLANADLILVMSAKQRQVIARKWPEMLGKTLLFGMWRTDKPIDDRDIPDPYQRSDEVCQLVYDTIKTASLAWRKKLKNTDGKSVW
ncbi:low molecular weight phosphotyrosine protein phosphatase [Halovibrio sp. HP20-50]|uniref:arsenate reductase/protein-tyrosine-phosphatase family protein n=1 Tax=Halovibrio sp. HP20-59 TaxID=3080275 RepID=UPI00294AB749|nr:low molecular weight phosphotyrosine protein phosphatase [Halovibrio sp. HP20-59]MEA2120214.1 low molecular weight phosphotyrosine protein phosphatase [Halovibrio sp. HP20-59]